jgi:DNA-directed RNA polymerase subunit RPC12/RpoP
MKTVLRYKRKFVCVQCWNKTPEINQGRGAREIVWVPFPDELKKYKCCSCGEKGLYMPASRH